MRTERVDDIPLLTAEFAKSELSSLISQHFPDHGNWTGAEGGKVAVGFLTYILSCSDHRISHVESWAEQRIETLRVCLDCPDLSAKDLTDDKLGILLDKLSDATRWNEFEHAHNQRLINVYNLDTKEDAIRLDAFITQSHREADEDFKYGYAKHHRADLPQLKTMVATMGRLTMPMFSLTVSGNTPDDVLYLPVIEELIPQLSTKHHLFVGDSKMGSSEIRNYIDSKEHYYLMPLNRKQCTQEQLAVYLDQRPPNLTPIKGTAKEEIKALAFEKSSDVVDDKGAYVRTERRILVYSPRYGKRLEEAFDSKLDKTIEALSVAFVPKRGRKVPKNMADAKSKVSKILSKYKVGSFIDIEINEQVKTRSIRAHMDKPARTESVSEFSLEYRINTEAAEEHRRKLGWQIYGSNAPKEVLSTEQAVECYRNEYRIEHKFDELLNRVTALMPVYLHKPNRIKALVNLLLLALKYVSLIQYQVRNRLSAAKQNIKELYPGNPGRATDKPTTNMLLRAFKNITLVIMPLSDQTVVKITDLQPTQIKILESLGLPLNTYGKFNELVLSDSCFSET